MNAVAMDCMLTAFLIARPMIASEDRRSRVVNWNMSRLGGRSTDGVAGFRGIWR